VAPLDMVGNKGDTGKTLRDQRLGRGRTLRCASQTLRMRRLSRFPNGEKQLSMRAYSQQRRLFERYENVQNIQRRQA
jgi:hypothetical protein